MESPFPSSDQALSLWSGSADSKTLDYQRTHDPREYQIMRTSTKPPRVYKTQHHPTANRTPGRTPHPNNKQDKNTNPIISRQNYHLTQPCRGGRGDNSLPLPEHKHMPHPAQNVYEPQDRPQEGRNQKEERIQPSSRKEFNFL